MFAQELLIPLVTAEQMRALDQSAMEGYRIPSMVLMERAGYGVFERLREWFAPLERKRVAVVCGKGNNGGDGLVIARYLWESGAPTHIFLLAPPSTFKGDAAVQWQIVHRLGIPTTQWSEAVSDQPFEAFDLIVDALLGTGVKGEVEGLLREAIEAINRSGLPIVAVDIPSGLEADTGHTLGAAVQATYTVTMGLPKRGFFLAEGIRHVGQWAVAEIGIPKQELRSVSTGVYLLTEPFVRAHLPSYPPDAHKGDRGHLLVVGGSVGLTGAPALAGISALRIGAGLVTVAVPERIQPVVASFYPELMTLSLPDGGTGVLTPAGVEYLLEQAGRFDGLVLGPGLSQAEPVGAALQSLLQEWHKPLLIDADGLSHLAHQYRANPNFKLCHPELSVLTPHPGEAARLLGVRSSEVQRDRLGALKRLQEQFGCTLVLKGAYTLIGTDHPHTVYVCPFAEPALATGGSGDVLSGLIGGLMGQGLGPSIAAAVGAYLHALAGEWLAQTKGFGFTARDLSEAIQGVARCNWERH